MTDEELIERLLGGCSCNMETSPCMAEDDCRLDMEAARRICSLLEQLEAAKRDAKEAEAYARELEVHVLTATYALRAMAGQDGAAIDGEPFVFMAKATLEQMESPQCP